MNADILAKAKAFLAGLAALAEITPSTADDQAVAFLQSVLNYPMVQALIGHLLELALTRPGLTPHEMVQALPPGVP